MKIILFYIVCICFLLYFIRSTKPAGSVQDVAAEENIENSLAGTKKTSSADMEKYKHLSGEINNLYSDGSTACQMHAQQCQHMLASVDNYVQRFVSLFLITSNLQDHEVRDPGEQIVIDLEISVSGEDLAYLQNYSKSLKGSGFQKDLTKLNAIFSKIARHKMPSFEKQLWRSFLSYLWSIDYYSILSKPSFYRVFSFIIILTGTWTFRHYLFSKSLCTFILIVVNSTILWEGLVLYWKKIKEADIKLYVETLQMKNLAEECKPENIRWYNSFVSLFWPDKCLHYYQNMAKNAEDEVSLFQCILDTYAFYLVRMPVKLCGVSIRDFTSEIVASLPGPLQYIVGIPLFPLFAVTFAFFFLVLWGKQFRLSFFGAAVEIGDAQPKNKMLDSTGSERGKSIRKLKPWTKDRFSRNCIADSGKLWKLTAAKSSVDVPHEQPSNSITSSATVVSTEAQHE